MEILGIGMSELVFIIIIALIVLGPRDMQKAGRTIGKFLRSIVTSDGWKIFQQTSRELRTLPNKLMREANDEVNQIGKQIRTEINPSSSPAAHGSDTPNMPPRSRPYTPDSTPIKPSENTASSSASEQKENESGQQKDA